jgi:hypothetical protein
VLGLVIAASTTQELGLGTAFMVGTVFGAAIVVLVVRALQGGGKSDPET